MLPRALFSVLSFIAATAGADERTDFLAAEAALKAQDRGRFEQLSSRLRHYPLYPYLVFAELTQDLKAAPDERIEDFLDRYSDTPLADRLRLAYLRRLADAGRWADYVRFYRPDDSVERQCFYLRALIETHRETEAMPRVESLWLSGTSRPGACDPLFEQWRAAGHLSNTLLWRRFRLAMEAGEPELARHLAQGLPPQDRRWSSQWLDLDRDPTGVLDTDAFQERHPRRAAILAHAIQGLARRDPARALEVLNRSVDWLADDPAARERAHGALGRALTATGDRLGLLYWDGVGARAETFAEQERRLRAALRLRAWDWLAKWIARLPEGAPKRERWLYWQGRAEEQLGRREEALVSFARAAEQRSFWGFMAADRLERPYALTHRPVPVAPERMRRLEQSLAYRRILELHRLGREVDVRREWRAVTRGLDPEGLMAAARLAATAGWHDQAILTLARADYWDDLELRFPLEHQALVDEQAWQSGVDPAWIYAVVRQESLFARTIASGAGAIGLMQLMPGTAIEVAGELGLARPSRGDLHDPAVNIALGSGYLARMRDRFGHLALATAAYNAGPERVKGWLPSACTPADLWIALIPFEETRSYVERVLAYRIIYEQRLGTPPSRLSELLPRIPAADFWSDGRLASRGDQSGI